MDPNQTTQGPPITNPVEMEPATDLIQFRLASFADFNLGPIRSFPTDQTPILSLTPDPSGRAAFAPSGTGKFSSRCIGSTFDYSYQADTNSGRNRLTIDRLEDIDLYDNGGCEPGDDLYESEAFDVALPFFSGANSFLSDLSKTLLTLFGSESGILSFQLATDSPAEPGAALSLTGSQWTLLAYRFGVSRVTPAPASDPLSLLFNDDGTLAGNFKCRSLIGVYESQESAISFSNVNFTDDSCDSEVDATSVAASMQLRDAITMVMAGPTSAIRQGSRLYLRANDVTLVLEGRESFTDEQRMNTSVLATGSYPIPNAELGLGDALLIQAVRDTNALNTLWNGANAQGNNLGSPPAIDFEQSVVMYLQLGLRPHLGESLTVRSATHNGELVLIEVDTRLSDNDVPFLDDCAYDDALAHPFSFVLVSNFTPLPEQVTVIDHQSSSCSGL